MLDPKDLDATMAARWPIFPSRVLKQGRKRIVSISTQEHIQYSTQRDERATGSIGSRLNVMLKGNKAKARPYLLRETPQNVTTHD